MTFVNEFISDEDVIKYNLEKIDDALHGATKARDWTVDKDRGFYLRHVAQGREEWGHITTWNLFWKGNVVVFEKQTLEAKRKTDQTVWAHILIEFKNLSHEEKLHLKEIKEVLEEAILAHGDAGVYSKIELNEPLIEYK